VCGAKVMTRTRASVRRLMASSVTWQHMIWHDILPTIFK
jgi:hypothetical protein